MFSKFLIKNSPAGSISKTVASELNRMDTGYPPFNGGIEQKFDHIMKLLSMEITPKARQKYYKEIDSNPLLFTLFLICIKFQKTPNSLIDQLENVRQVIIDSFNKNYGNFKEGGSLQPAHDYFFQNYHCKDFVTTCYGI